MQEGRLSPVGRRIRPAIREGVFAEPGGWTTAYTGCPDIGKEPGHAARNHAFDDPGSSVSARHRAADRLLRLEDDPVLGPRGSSHLRNRKNVLEDNHVRSISLIVAILALGLCSAAVDAQPSSPVDSAGIVRSLGRLPIHFVENHGVCSEEVAYFVSGADKTLFFTPTGMTIAFHDRTRRWAVKLDFVGADPNVKPRGEDRRRATISYFVGREADWKTGLPTYGKIVYENLWPGIDLVYRGRVNRMKYEFRVRPGADPRHIRLRYRGADRVFVTETGGLRVETPVGGFEDASPVAYQVVDGERRPVEMAYDRDRKIEASGAGYRFRLGHFDPTRPLILDPAILVYCGYIGGADYDDNYSVAVDSLGNAYVTGETGSNESTHKFPVAVGPDLTYNGAGDAYVAKVDQVGGGLVYCGYIGGTDYDYGEGIAVDATGAAYLIGYTDSDETSEKFPVKVGPDLTFAGNTDAFVAKIDATGKSLVYCGYIGGNRSEYPFDIAVDAAGNAYVVGDTDSDENTGGFPVKGGPDLTHNGSYDAFVAKVNPQGSAFVYCGYIGGAQSDGAWGGITVDAQGNAYVVGETRSNQTTDRFPVIVGPDLTFNSTTGADLFVAKVNATGGALDYCGYIGGAKNEYAGTIAVDAAGSAYVCGETASNETTDNFPVKVGPDLTYNGGSGDAFVAKVNPQGLALDYCGYIGGSSSEGAWDIAVDGGQNAYVVGDTGSSEATFPVTVGPDLTYNGGGDAFVARVNRSGKVLDYCGYIGGQAADAAYGVDVDPAGSAFVTGDVDSNETTDRFPVKNGPDLTYNLNTDAFVAKVEFVDIVATGSPRPGNTVTFLLVATGDPGRAYQVGSSLGIGPIPIGNRALGLSPDAMLFLSVSGVLPQVFSAYVGFIAKTGQAQAAINLPNAPSLVGLRIHSAFVTLDALAPFGLRSISNTASFTVLR